MITNTGRNYMFDYLSGRLQRWAGKMAVGIGESAASATDKRLDFHVADAPIDIIVPDFSQQIVIIRGVVPVSLECEIHEIGVFFEPTPHTDRVIARFNPLVEQFSGGTQTFDSRIGDSAVVAVDGDTIEYFGYPLLLAQMSASNDFRLAVDSSGGAATINARFIVDENNYYEYDFGVDSAAGYKVLRAQKRSFSPTGYPDWNAIQAIRFDVTADVGTELRLDNMRTGAQSSEEKLLARQVVTTPVKTHDGIETEIEYKVNINFGN